MKKFIVALQFLTRISIRRDVMVSDAEMATSTSMYPLVGLLIGLLLAIGSWLGLQIGLEPGLTAALVLVASIVLTGGLHLDGLMDSADGLLSNRSRERIIAIMKDSHVGANGIIAVLVLLLLKLQLLPVQGMPWLLLIVWMPLLGRWAALYLAAIGRHTGAPSQLGSVVIGRVGRRELLWGSLWCLGALIFSVAMFALLFSSPLSTVHLAGLATVLWGLAWYIAQRGYRMGMEKIGGVSGDIIGACIEVTELGVLATGVVWMQIFGGF